MKENLDKITAKIVPLINKFRRYKTFIFIIGLLTIYGFLVLRINTLNSREPNDDDITAKLKTVSRPKIDQTIVDKIQQLQDNSVQVKSLFNSARNNPFQE